MVMRLRGNRRASAIRPAATPRSSAKDRNRRDHKHGSDPLVIGKPDRDRDSKPTTIAISAR